MSRIPSLTRLRDSGLVLTAAAVTALAVDELLAGRWPTRRPGGSRPGSARSGNQGTDGVVPPLAARLGWLHRVDELGGRVRPATCGDVAAARAAAALDGGDGVFGHGYTGGEPLLPGDPGYSAVGVSYYRVIPAPTPPAASPGAGDRDAGQLQADVDQLRRASERLRRTAVRVRQIYGDDWIAGSDQDDDDRIQVWSVPAAAAFAPDEDAALRPILTVAAGLGVDPDEALALAEHVAGFPPAAALAIAAMLDDEAGYITRHGHSPDGRTALVLAVAASCVREPDVDPGVHQVVDQVADEVAGSVVTGRRA